jgi:hypothetical protein
MRDSSFEDTGHKVRRPAAAGRQDAKRDLQLQQTAGNAAVGSLLSRTPGSLVRSVVRSEGKQLDGATSSFVQSALGADVSGIRVHDGPEAESAAHSVDADMFASGNHLVAPKGLDVTTREGAFKTLHEVHHIVNQQAKGPVDGRETEDGLKISDPSDRFEQEADRAAAEGVARHFGG